MAIGLGQLLLEVPELTVHRSLLAGSSPSKTGTGEPRLPAQRVTTMGESLIKACKVMGMRRIGLVVAGEKASADKLAAHLEQQGLVVVKRIAMGLSDEEAMAQASVAEITAACQAVSGDGVEVGPSQPAGKGSCPELNLPFVSLL